MSVPVVVCGPTVPDVVGEDAGLVPSRVTPSVAVVLALPTASLTSRQTVLAPSPAGSVCVTVPL